MLHRDYKERGQGEYYHIYNRGNAKQDVFLDEQDFSFFLLRLRESLFPENNRGDRRIPLPKNAFSLVSYCLMSNHFHLLIRPNIDIPTSKLLLKVCTSYSIYFNKKYNRVGHIFQDQFKQIRIHNDNYLLWLSAYIHHNPTVAGLVTDPKHYQWSSHAEYLDTDKKEILCDTTILLGNFQNKKDYEKFVSDSFQPLKERKDLKALSLEDN